MMNLKHLYKFKKELDEKNVFFGFIGPLSQDLFVEIGLALKNRIKQKDANPSKALKVFALFVEQVQNIIHYSAERLSTTNQSNRTELSHGVIVIGFENEKYYIMCGNLIESEMVEHLQKRLITLQNMDKDELKQYYKMQRRKKDTEAGSKGAGLGFIELARKTTQPFEFDFQSIDENLSFFSLRTFI